MAELSGARVLITGGAGVVGSTIADQVVGAGATEVVVVDNFSRGRASNLAWARQHGRVTVLEGEIRDRSFVERRATGLSANPDTTLARSVPKRDERRGGLRVRNGMTISCGFLGLRASSSRRCAVGDR